MKLLRRVWVYPLVGIVTAAVIGVADGTRGLIGTSVAWALCAMPIVVERVALARRVRKTSKNRGLVVVPRGLFLRLAWTLGGAALLWRQAGGWLGLGFWPALLVFYQAGLLVRTRDAIDGLNRT